jgi:hypothetical protein
VRNVWWGWGFLAVGDVTWDAVIGFFYLIDGDGGWDPKDPRFSFSCKQGMELKPYGSHACQFLFLTRKQ